MARYQEGLSEALGLIRRHGEHTRSELVARTGLSRTAVNQRLDALAAAGLIVEMSGEVPTRGRPADRFAFNAERGHVLVADMGVTQARIALCDMVGRIVCERVIEVDVGLDPEIVMDQLTVSFDAVLDEAGVGEALGIGVGVPAPVKADAGFSVNPPIMPSWNRFDVPAWLANRYSVPVLLEKDANVMAYGEARFRYADVGNLMLVKVGTGIGAGVVIGGELFRGSDGAAGDIGHTPVETLQPEDGPLCKCGNRGCLEAYAGGWAILRDLRERDSPRYVHADLVELIAAGDPEALEMIRRSGRLIGSAIASSINLFNPQVVVLGGRLAVAGGDHFFAGVREMVYRRSLPLATAGLRIERSELYPRGGAMGLASLVVDSLLAPDSIGALMEAQDG